MNNSNNIFDDIVLNVKQDSISYDKRVNIINELKKHLTKVCFKLLNPSILDNEDEQKQYVDPAELVPFGSFAFKTNSAESDIDICMLSYMPR